MIKKTFITLFLLFFTLTPTLYAHGIINPVIEGNLGDIPTEGTSTKAATAVAILLARFFSAALALGSLIMMIYFVLSAYKWLTASDSNAVSQARQGILNAIIGTAILASVFAIANLVAPLLGLSTATCNFPSQICWPTF